MLILMQDGRMRTTVTVDDELMAQAEELTGIHKRSALIRSGIEALIERESARQLARLGGTEPQLVAPSRRRPRQ
jgi:Arc/MetJ family transcription regulator